MLAKLVVVVYAYCVIVLLAVIVSKKLVEVVNAYCVVVLLCYWLLLCLEEAGGGVECLLGCHVIVLLAVIVLKKLVAVLNAYCVIVLLAIIVFRRSWWW